MTPLCPLDPDTYCEEHHLATLKDHLHADGTGISDLGLHPTPVVTEHMFRDDDVKKADEVEHMDNSIISIGRDSFAARLIVAKSEGHICIHNTCPKCGEVTTCRCPNQPEAYTRGLCFHCNESAETMLKGDTSKEPRDESGKWTTADVSHRFDEKSGKHEVQADEDIMEMYFRGAPSGGIYTVPKELWPTIQRRMKADGYSVKVAKADNDEEGSSAVSPMCPKCGKPTKKKAEKDQTATARDDSFATQECSCQPRTALMTDDVAKGDVSGEARDATGKWTNGADSTKANKDWDFSDSKHVATIAKLPTRGRVNADTLSEAMSSAALFAKEDGKSRIILHGKNAYTGATYFQVTPEDSDDLYSAGTNFVTGGKQVVSIVHPDGKAYRAIATSKTPYKASKDSWAKEEARSNSSGVRGATNAAITKVAKATAVSLGIPEQHLKVHTYSDRRGDLSSGNISNAMHTDEDHTVHVNENGYYPDKATVRRAVAHESLHYKAYEVKTALRKEKPAKSDFDATGALKASSFAKYPIHAALEGHWGSGWTVDPSLVIEGKKAGNRDLTEVTKHYWASHNKGNADGERVIEEQLAEMTAEKFMTSKLPGTPQLKAAHAALETAYGIVSGRKKTNVKKDEDFEHMDNFITNIGKDSFAARLLLMKGDTSKEARGKDGKWIKAFLWALPKDKTDRLHEKPLTSFALTPAQVEQVKTAAGKDGWHSFRVVPDNNDLPDFRGAVKKYDEEIEKGDVSGEARDATGKWTERTSNDKHAERLAKMAGKSNEEHHAEYIRILHGTSSIYDRTGDKSRNADNFLSDHPEKMADFATEELHPDVVESVREKAQKLLAAKATVKKGDTSKEPRNEKGEWTTENIPTPIGLNAQEGKAWETAKSAIADVRRTHGQPGPTAKKVFARAHSDMRKSAEVLGVKLPYQDHRQAIISADHLFADMVEQVNVMGAVKKEGILTKEEKEVFCKIAKSDRKKQIVYGMVYAPDLLDQQGDMMTAEVIEEMAHAYLRKADLKDTIDAMHDNVPKACHPVESWIQQSDDPDGNFLKGSWCMGIKIDDPIIWAKVEKGEINGFSFQGTAARRKVLVEYEFLPTIIGVTEAAEDGHTHTFMTKMDNDGKPTYGRTSEAADGHFHVIRRGTATDEAEGHQHRIDIKTV